MTADHPRKAHLAALLDAIRQLDAEALGVYRVRVIRAQDLPAAMADVASGIPGALQILQISSQIMTEVDDPASIHSCLLCGAPITSLADLGAWAVLSGYAQEHASVGLVNLVCSSCLTHYPAKAQLAQAIVSFWKDNIARNLRVITPSATVGHA